MTGPPGLRLIFFPLERAHLLSFAMARGTMPRSGDLGYTLHQALTETFGQATPKPFHLFAEPGCQLIAYSVHGAAELSNIAKAQQALVPDWEFASQAINLKGMQTASLHGWSPGQRYRFTVRARPVCRISHPTERKLPRECDVFLRAVASKSDPGGAWLDRETVYRSWFREQIPERAAQLLSVGISRMSRTQVYRKGAASVDGPDVTFAGILEVRDPDMFNECVKRGIGRHRAFGFGMLMLASLSSDSLKEARRGARRTA
jgi:CRISPR system Cascade subunit CasE